jgi:hypothetical protein
MPDKQAFARKVFVACSSLAILNEEVLLTVGISVSPESMNLESDLHVVKRYLTIGGLHHGLNPILV